MRDLSTFGLPVNLRRQAPLDAIVVPSARRAVHLRHAARLAERSKTLLVVLASRECTADRAESAVAATGCRALVVEVPEGYEHDYFAHQTSRQSYYRAVTADRKSDLSLKRNVGLLLARLLGWRTIMFLDDDILNIGLGHLAKVSAHLDNYQVAGLMTREFPDNSVVCHANRLRGAWWQDNFVTGSTLGVNCADQPLPFFPDIYNEDWFFFLEHAAKGNLPCLGEARQLRYEPFSDPSRAAHEEFGDLLAEGLYALIGTGAELSSATEDYWETFIDARWSLLDEILVELKEIETTEAIEAIGSINAARGQLSTITPQHCVTYLEAWQEDRRRFEATAAGLANVGGYANAFDVLQLKEWRVVPG